MKSGGFHLKSGGFHVKSTHNLIKSDVSTKTSVWGVHGGGYDPRFHEIHIAPLLHSSNWIVLIETPAFTRFWVDFTWNLPDFTWNPPDFMYRKTHLQGILTLCLLSLLVSVQTHMYSTSAFFRNWRVNRKWIAINVTLWCNVTSHTWRRQ